MQESVDFMNMMNFKIQAFFTTLMIGSVSALTISDAISQKVNAQATPSCNNATIKGSYGSYLTQNFRTDNYVEVGLWIFDGAGNLTAKDTLNYNGTIVQNRTLVGTYSVEPNCTVQITDTDFIRGTATNNAVIVDSGKEIILIELNPNTVLSGTLKRVN